MQNKQNAESTSTILRCFLDSLKHERFMAHHGNIQSNWLVFDTGDEAVAAFKAAGGYEVDQRSLAVSRDASNHIRDSKIEFDYRRLRRRIHTQLKWIWRKNKISPRHSYTSPATEAMLLGKCIVAWGDSSHPDTKYVLECWNVWQQGFALFGELDGKFYVYRRY